MSTANEQLSSLAAWGIAEKLGCGYSGDCSPIPHGGFFFDPRDWKDGYASCVEFWFDDQHERQVVDCGTINRVDEAELAKLCAEYGDTLPRSIELEIDACHSKWGAEPCEDMSQSFPEDTDEDEIWNAVLPWIRGLAE